MRKFRGCGARLLCTALASFLLLRTLAAPAQGLESPPEEKSGGDHPFDSRAQSVTLSVGGAYGIAELGSLEEHHLALLGVSYGHGIGRTLGQGSWYQGNFELRAELTTGAQFSPDLDWIVNLTPHLRYNFTSCERIVPFFDGGAGVTATGIDSPDLGGVFQFNEQVGGGLHYLCNDTFALTFEVRYMHVSCAGINRPNRGMNGIIGLIGVTRSF